jgi:nucleoside-diphosphate-sugar epimerase
MSCTLITGGSGFIGYHFQQTLDQKTIVNLDLVAPQFSYGSRYVQGDIRDPECLRKALRAAPIKQILCLAAEHKDFGISRPDYFRTNEHGTQVICDAATAADIDTIIFFSSVAVYGGLSGPSTELTRPAPDLPYGESKLAGEKVLEKWASEDPARRVLIIRPTVVFGERNFANMLRLIIQVDSNRYAHIGAADNIKSVAYVKNLVAATMYARARLEPGVHVFNYADGPQMSVRAIADTIADALKRRRPATLPYAVACPIGWAFDAAIKVTGRDLPISTARIRKALTETHHTAQKIHTLGFTPRFSSVEGLRRMVEWYTHEKAAHRAPVPGGTAGG